VKDKNIIKVRKDQICQKCGATIDKGENAVTTKFYPGNRDDFEIPITWHMCMNCYDTYLRSKKCLD